jgi:Zn-dependent protease
MAQAMERLLATPKTIPVFPASDDINLIQLVAGHSKKFPGRVQPRLKARVTATLPAMDSTNVIASGLIQYLMLVGLLTFHEFGHAWTAMKCGDDTARLQGRVSLNPLVHIDPIGTVLLPLLMIFLPGVGQFLVGYAKPVPVNPYNLNQPKRDDILVTLAGPGMNLLLAIGLVALARVGLMIHSDAMTSLSVQAAQLSLILCFFNLIPVPPLDGSQVLRVVTGMSHETYANFARFGFIIIIVLINIPPVRYGLMLVTNITLNLLGRIFGLM